MSIMNTSINNTTAGSTSAEGWSLKGKIGLLLGPVLFLGILLISLDMPPAAQRCLAAAVWIAVWWITEAVPLAVTSLLPLIFIPLLGLGNAQTAAIPYANKNIILFLGGFIIAQSIVRWDLHQRLALIIVNLIGTGPRRIILGFMASSAFLSLWISNSAAAIALMPIGLSVSHLVTEEIKKQDLPIPTSRGKFNFGLALMLGIAFGATIGGLGTPIGSPPNLIFISALQEMYPEMQISFVKWMSFGIPLVVILIPVAWLVLISIFKPGFKEIPGGKQLIRKELRTLGNWSRAEISVMGVFIFTALMWITRPFLINPYISASIDDSTIAILGAVLLFVIPVSWEKGKFAMDWEWATKIPWGVLLLFGGGLALASTIESSGLAGWMGSHMEIIRSLSPLLIVLTIVIFASTLSEMTSNTATAAMMMPVMAALAVATGMSPVATMLAAAIAVSFVYLLPVGTPPNTIIYSSGYLRVIDMIRGGIWIKLVHIIIGSLLIYYFALPVFLTSAS